jgi:hypothetical protein
MGAMVNQWGPALLIVFSVLLGVLYNNKRLDDLQKYIDMRFDAMEKRFVEFQASIEKRFAEFQTAIRSELSVRSKPVEDRLKAVEERLDRLEHPVSR